ncbi:hypothetical protein GQ42DRAFT_33778 [Ramicandelaber brevisporus]|nr:hypothetical protein GQ42DRAFT_33778 [Ramicandelaber brevisporus]
MCSTTCLRCKRSFYKKSCRCIHKFYTRVCPEHTINDIPIGTYNVHRQYLPLCDEPAPTAVEITPMQQLLGIPQVKLPDSLQSSGVII